MKINSECISIELKQNEIIYLWNIIMFALDWQESDNTSKMTDNELKMAKKLADLLGELK